MEHTDFDDHTTWCCHTTMVDFSKAYVFCVFKFVRAVVQVKSAIVLATLACFEALTLTRRAAAQDTFFSEPIGDQARQLMQSAGCKIVEHYGQVSDGEFYVCSPTRDSGIPGTTELKLFGPQPAWRFGGRLHRAQDRHVFMQWTDNPPGGLLLPPHVEREEAEHMLRNVLDAIGVRRRDSIVRAFFAEGRRNGHKETTFRGDGLKVVAMYDDDRGMAVRRLFVSEPNARLPAEGE